MRILQSGLERGIVVGINVQILYPDGTVYEGLLNPSELDFGMLVYSDMLLKKYVLPFLDDDVHEATAQEWDPSGGQWDQKPTFVLVSEKSASEDPEERRSWPPSCNCCIAKHIADSLDRPRLKQPTELSRGVAKIESVTERGVLRRLLVETEYPNGERVMSIRDSVADDTGLIVFSERLLEKFILQALDEGHRDLVLNAWEGEVDDWTTRPSYVYLTEAQGRICPHWDCCEKVHKMNDALVG